MGKAYLLLAGALALGLDQQAHAQLYWDTNGSTGGAAGDGTPLTAPGTWDAATANWSTSADGDISTVAWTPGAVANFSAGTHVTSNSTITVSGTQSIGGLTFEEGNIILNTGTLGLSGTPTFNAASGASATINATISGAGRWTKTGPGTISVRASGNSNSGGVSITGGTVVIGNGNTDTQLGPAPGGAVSNFLILDGGTLRTDNSSSTTMHANRGVLLDAGGGTFNINGGGTWQVNGVTSGTGRLTKTGADILILNSASNTYSGGTTINQGVVSLLTDSTTAGAAARLGTVPASAAAGANNLIFNGGGLRSTNGSAWVLHANRGLTVNSGGAIFENTAAGTVTVAGTVTGTGTITKQIGTGATVNLLVFSADNSSTYSGKFAVTSGYIQSNSLVNNGEAGFGQAPASFLSDAITLNGGGIRTGPNNTTINVTRGITLGANGGILNTATTASIQVDSVISGSGALTKTSVAGAPVTTSTAILTGANTYTGDTNLDVGVLQVDGSLANGNINIATGTTLNGSGTLTYNIAGDLADLTAIAGTGILNIAGLDIVLNVTGTQTSTEYVLVDKLANSANVSGSSFALESLPANWDIDYDGTATNPNAIVAVLVPEPSALALFAFGGLTLARRRRRARIV